MRNAKEGSSTKILSPEDQAFETHYVHSRSTPLKIRPDDTMSAYYLSTIFPSYNTKLRTKPQYQEFLCEYEELGHMSEIPNDPSDDHPFIKADSVTTKVRVVFDASARSSFVKSLNDLLMIGLTIQDDLFIFLLRFRTHKYVIAADIAKMYRLITIHLEDRRYHKVLWKESINGTIKTYQLNTVTYETDFVLYLAIRTLHQLAQDEEHSYSIGARILKRDFYVDDLLTIVNTLEKARSLRDVLIDITTKGGFELRQLVLNESKLIESLSIKSDQSNLSLDDKDVKKTLGLRSKATLSKATLERYSGILIKTRSKNSQDNKKGNTL